MGDPWAKLEDEPVYCNLICPDTPKGVKSMMKLAVYFTFESTSAISYKSVVDQICGRSDFNGNMYVPRMAEIIFRENKKLVVNNPEKYFKKFILEKDGISIVIGAYLNNTRKRTRLALFCTTTFVFKMGEKTAGYLKIVDSPGKL